MKSCDVTRNVLHSIYPLEPGCLSCDDSGFSSWWTWVGTCNRRITMSLWIVFSVIMDPIRFTSLMYCGWDLIWGSCLRSLTSTNCQSDWSSCLFSRGEEVRNVVMTSTVSSRTSGWEETVVNIYFKVTFRRYGRIHMTQVRWSTGGRVMLTSRVIDSISDFINRPINVFQLSDKI